jgi:DNA-binding XRE family transcriptional regulator
MSLDRTTFAAALQNHRDRLSLTQAEAATLLEVSPRVYWQWEKGMSNALVVTMEGVLARLKAAKKK